jgi:glutaconate CoA-transferase subunit A
MPIVSLAEAVRTHVHDGDSVALEGFTHLIPFAAGHELIRQRVTDLHLIRMTPDLIYDQLVGVGAARALTFSWGGNPGVGSAHRLREAIESDWPRPLAINEHSHAGMGVAYTAGAAGLPFGVLRGYVGTDLVRVNPAIRSVTCPYTGEVLATVPALNPDVTILHAQRADRRGNVFISGIIGAQKEAALAARRLIVTVEEIVEDLAAPANSIVLPHWVVSAVACVPGGAWPSYARGYYQRDNAFYLAWDAISRDRAAFGAWIDRHVRGTADHAGFLRSITGTGGEA